MQVSRRSVARMLLAGAAGAAGIGAAAEEAPKTGKTGHYDIVFDGPPGPVAGRFVEVEDDQLHSVRLGTWLKRDDGFWALRVSSSDVTLAAAPTEPPPTFDELREILETHLLDIASDITEQTDVLALFRAEAERTSVFTVDAAHRTPDGTGWDVRWSMSADIDPDLVQDMVGDDDREWAERLRLNRAMRAVVMMREARVDLDDNVGVSILFNLGRVVILSMNAPNRRGYISTGMDHCPQWFAGASSPGYLAEKFLTKTWDLQRAIRDLREVGTDEAMLLATAFVEMSAGGSASVVDSSWYIGQIIDAVDCSDGVPGDGYDEAEVSWLNRVQGRFSTLYYTELVQVVEWPQGRTLIKPRPHPMTILAIPNGLDDKQVDAFVLQYREAMNRAHGHTIEIVKPS
jgi:hypothetical protein